MTELENGRGLHVTRLPPSKEGIFSFIPLPSLPDTASQSPAPPCPTLTVLLSNLLPPSLFPAKLTGCFQHPGSFSPFLGNEVPGERPCLPSVSSESL